MDDWAHGYDVSVGYTYGFCREMAPDWLDFCAAIAGVAAPRGGDGAPFRYLELGSGQGVGLCLLAAANPRGTFVGVDFLPEHVDHAARFAQAAGIDNVRFHCADFLSLARDWPADYGTFDYVTMHGVYTWVAPAVREAVVGCLMHAVRAGGLVYNGYNAQPGWLSAAPFQHITRLIADTAGGTSRATLDRSIALFDRLRDAGTETFKLLPGLAPRIERLRGRSLNYLAAEYLNEHWQPKWHSAVARELAAAGLDYVGTATAAEIVLPAPLPPALQQAIAAEDDPAVRQDVLDFIINQSFRRDIYRRAGGEGVRRDIGAVPIHLTRAPDAGADIHFETAFGEVTLQPPAFAATVAALAQGPLTIAELTALPAMRPHGEANARQILLLLLHARTLAVGASPPGDTTRVAGANAVVARGVADGLPYDHVACAALGAAVPASEDELLLLDAWFAGAADAATLARDLAARRSRLGRPTAAADAAAFLDETLPRWRALGAVI